MQTHSEQTQQHNFFRQFRPESIPVELRVRKQWVCFKLIWDDEQQKYKKLPKSTFAHECNRHNDKRYDNCASSTDSSTWTSFDEAIEAVHRNDYDAIGFAFSSNDPYTGIDLDHTRDSRTGMIEARALKIAEILNSYCEGSISGQGIHIIVKASLPKAFTKPFEIYDKERFFIFTGNHIPDFPTTIESRQAELDAIIKEHFQQQQSKSKGNGHDTSGFWRGDIPHGSRHDSIRDKIYRWRMLGVPKEKVFELASDAAKLLGKHDEKEIERLIDGAFEKYPTLHSPEDITDLRNSARFAERFRESFLHSHPEKKWFAWTGEYHAPDRIGEVIQSGKDFMQELLEGSQSITDEATRIKVRARIVQYESQPRIEAMINLARSDLPILPSDFDRDPLLFNCANVTLDLGTSELTPRSHSRLDFISKITPVIFDPSAKCPTFLRFLNEIFGNDTELVSCLQCFFGLMLTGLTEQVFLIFYGLGDNGKSTLIELMRFVLGDYAVSLPQSSLLLKKYDEGIRNDLAMLKGARFAVCMESGLDRKLDEALIKQLTGQDTITCRFLHKEFFSFQPECKIILGTNHLPQIQSNSYSIWKRVKTIPFDVVIPKEKQDTTLPARLRAEASGILNWMLEGYQSWRKNGLQFPQAVSKATENYRSEMDVLAEFIAECCVELPNLTVKAGMLFKAYKKWCESTGNEPLNQMNFGTLITNRGFWKEKTRDGIFYKGIGLAAKESQS